MNSTDPLTVLSNSEKDTRALGEAVSASLEPGSLVALVGELGSGKTQFVKGASKGLGVPSTDRVTSPTFKLLNIYKGKMPIWHVDVYRLEYSYEVADLMIEEAREQGAVVFVEWADRVENFAKEAEVLAMFEIKDEQKRLIKLNFRGENAKKMISKLKNNFEISG